MVDEQVLAQSSLTELSRLLTAGKTTSEAVVAACLARIAAREPLIHAWAHLDPVHALAEARARDREPRRGPLHGVPIGIKDIIDTADQPTRYGSPIYADHRPARDATCVDLLRQTGAVSLGKTATTEFAGPAPAATVNPHARDHTPGGSSSGSAAAVADFMVPAALGTQTLGSAIRPAAFCGVVGFKPSYGLLPLDGVKPGAPTMDTVGILVRRAEDIAVLLSALTPTLDWERTVPSTPRIVVLQAPQWDKAQMETREAIVRAGDTFASAGARIEEGDGATTLDSLTQSAWTILRYENAQHLAREHKSHRDLLSPVLAAFLDRAAEVSRADYDAALAAADAARGDIDRLMATCDAILTAAVPGEAPAGLASTGDPVFNAAWTLAHLPCVALPAGTGPRGLPTGIQLVARRDGDAALAALARWAEAALAACPP